MLLPPIVKFRRRRRPLRKPPAAIPPAPPQPLTLVAATYESGTAVTLTFDRAIDIAAFNGSVVFLRDGDGTEFLYDASGGATLLSPAVARLTLVEVEGDSAPGVVLNADPSCNIVAVDDGGTWAGVADLALPFP